MTSAFSTTRRCRSSWQMRIATLAMTSDMADNVWKILKNLVNLSKYTFLSPNQYAELRHNLCLKYGIATLDGHIFPTKEEIKVIDHLIPLPYIYLVCGRLPGHISYKPLSARLAISVRMLNLTFKPINKKWTMEDLLRMERAMRERHNTQGILLG